MRFEPLGAERTRVKLVMEYEPKGFVEKAGDAVGIPSGKIENAVERVTELLEKRSRETGGWPQRSARRPGTGGSR